MAIFTAAATFLLAGTALAGTFAVPLLAGTLALATSVGLNYAAQALAGNPNKDAPPAAGANGVQGKLQGGGDVPRSFNVGYSVTAGSLVYANTWGQIQPGGTELTPNAYLTQVIALADLPGGDLLEVWVDGELVTLGSDDEDRGKRVTEYVKESQPYLWIKYYDGTQTTADSLLTDTVSSVDRPYEATRVGKGVAYVIVTSLVNDTLFSGVPQLKFAVSGIPLYDPTKDSTNGGSGTHRWSDQSTWGGDGDDLPAVQAYNILRGIYYNGSWMYGLQLLTAARLPTVNWNAQINKCRATITGVSGPEATYRSGGQVSIDTQPVQVIEALLTSCQGRLSEIGGFYKIHLGTPDSLSFAFTDDDILSTEQQSFAPFFGLSDSVNGITATYPSPAEAWAMKPAPPLFDADFEAEDGSRRLLANPTFSYVPYPAQVQRLQKSALEEARRARRHNLVLPPAWWIVEPGDVGTWTSTRNGYVSKQFRVDGITDRGNLDVAVNITEVDPSDYDWTHATDFTPVTVGPTTLPRPEPQGIVDWFAEPYVLVDASTTARRPAIRIVWDNTAPGITGITYQVRLDGETEVVTSGNTDQFSVGSLIISQGLLPDTDYEVRGQFIPSAPRDMLWSDWLDVTTPDVKFGLADFDASLIALISDVEQYNDGPLNEALNLIASIAANQDARNWLDKKELRTQLDATAGGANARIEEVRLVAVDTAVAFATFSIAATATFGSTTAFVSETASAIATFDGYAAASYSVTLDVNGYATGFQLVNGGGGVSSFTVTSDKFQVAFPGMGGGTAVPVFTIANVGGVPKIALRGDMYADGTITVNALNVGTLTAISAHFGSATVDGDLTSTNGKMLIDFSNGRIVLSD